MRVKWQGESATRYFCSLEKARGVEKLLRELEIPDGGHVKYATGILEVTRDFYQSLFSSESVDEACNESLLSNITQVLTEQEARACEGPFTLDDGWTKRPLSIVGRVCVLSLLAMSKLW